jgi:O-glycosyl hydrolase
MKTLGAKDWLSRRLQWLRARQRLKPLYFVVFFAAIGLAALFIAKAATPTTSLQAEAGTLSGSASVVADGNASGGSAVRFGSVATPTPTMTATLDGNQKFQIMDGFGTSVNSGAWDNGELRPALDMLVDQNGSKIMRVIIENMDWEATNDDADPNNYNWTYYNNLYSTPRFEELWSTMAYLNQKGITDTMILNFMGQGPAWMGGHNLNTAQQDEWVEMVVSAAYYARNTRHLQFGYFAPNNEADWPGFIEGVLMNDITYAKLMNKVAVRLNALGLNDMQMIGPDNATCPGSYYDQMTTYPTLMAKVQHVTIHSYGGSDCGTPGLIADSPYADRNWWVSEFSIFDQALTQVGQGASALITWDGFDSIYNHAILNGHPNQPGNDAGNAPAMISYNSNNHTYTPRKDMYNFGQLFKYVPPGSQRVGISSSKSGMKLHAFVHPGTSGITIFGQNTTGSQQVIGGTLTNAPAASVLHYSQTNSTSNMATGANVPITNNTFAAMVPNNTVFTLTTL